MLSIFPGLLTYQMLAPFIIRILLSAIFIHFAFRELNRGSRDPKFKAPFILEGICGLLLLIGLFTQIAALILAIDLLVRLIKKIQSRSFLSDGVNYYLILFVLALSLLFTGAGFLAFDLPL